jgi:NodT family efflux transporter outer membrane factor (OMF) lipoprotein
MLQRYLTRPRAGTARTSRTSVAVASSLLAPLAGCKVGPDYVRPDAPVSANWIDQATGSGAAAQTTPEWWTQFGDPMLEGLVRESFEQNLTLRAAGLRVLQARAVRGITVGEFFPQQQEAVGNLTANRLSQNTPDGAADPSVNDLSLGLRAAWELDFWGRFRRAIESSDAQLLASVADYDAVLVTLAADVAAAYIQVRSFQERLTLARSNAQLQEDTLRLTEIRFKAGGVSQLDVVTARSLLSSTRSLIPQFEDGVRRSMVALCILLGRTPADLERELGGTAPVPTPPAQIALGIPADLLRRRPDVRRAERIAAAASAQIGVAEADFYPSISIVGATGFAASDFRSGTVSADLGDIFDSRSFQGFIGLSLNWPFLNYGRISNNVRLQDARFQEAVTQYQNTVLQAAADVETGLSSFLKNRERAAALADTVEAQRRAAELSLIQYRAGAVDFIRVNFAQTNLVEQQDQLAAARADSALGAVATYRALGGGWEVRLGREFIPAATAAEMRARTDWGDLISPGYQRGRDITFPRPSGTPADLPGNPP